MYLTANSTKSLRLPVFLIVLLIFLIAYPYLHQKFPDHIAIVEVSFAVLMISGISIFVPKKNLLVLMSFLASIVLIGIFLTDYTESRLLLFTVMTVQLIFFSIIFARLLAYIYEQQMVTLSKLYAAVTCYLVLGIIFAVLYAIIGSASPESFKYTVSVAMPGMEIFPHPDFFSEALYFSFVTLGTLGYGDWVPIFGPIKMVASLEAIAGQLFIAILIARLVGVQISQSILYKRVSNN